MGSGVENKNRYVLLSNPSSQKISKSTFCKIKIFVFVYFLHFHIYNCEARLKCGNDTKIISFFHITCYCDEMVFNCYRKDGKHNFQELKLAFKNHKQ